MSEINPNWYVFAGLAAEHFRLTNTIYSHSDIRDEYWEWYYGLQHDADKVILQEIERVKAAIADFREVRGLTVYLCGGINGLTDSEANDWRSHAKKCLTTKTLDPMRRDYRGKEAENIDAIVEGDLEDINSADFILVNAARPSWGTGMEVVYAHQLRKPIYSVVPSGPVSPWLRWHSTFIFDSLDKAIDKINGELQ